MKDSRIGLIGTGIMGEPMTRNLMNAGFSLHVYTRSKVKAEKLIQEGANWQDSPGEVTKNVDVIISMVCDSPDVEEVYLAQDGVIHQMHSGMLCIDMSTVSPQVTQKVASRIEKKGGSFLDAPVSGGKTGAEAGTLVIMVGGEDHAVARAKPIFDALGKSVVHCGPVGDGQLTKLCNQMLCGLNLLAVSEAVVFAQRVGLDPEKMIEAVRGGAAGSWALNNLGTRMISRDFEPMFMIDLQQKDLRITLETARQQIVPLPGTSLVHQLLAANQAANEGREGTQALVKTIERLANMDTRKP